MNTNIQIKPWVGGIYGIWANNYFVGTLHIANIDDPCNTSKVIVSNPVDIGLLADIAETVRSFVYNLAD